MGKLNGILPIEGTVGKITFAKTKAGIVVREKGGVSAERIANDPAYRRTRENNREFGRAGKTAGMLLGALRAVRTKADSRAMSRLVRRVMSAQKSDTTSKRGDRHISEGDPVLLEGFELNAASPLASAFFAPYELEISRPFGTFEFTVPDPVTDASLEAPAGATHFTIQVTCVLADFDHLTYTTVQATSARLAVGGTATLPSLQGSFTPAATATIITVLSISYYQEVNGSPYLLSNGAYNPAAIIRVVL